jgi:hypothetical protein
MMKQSTSIGLLLSLCACLWQTGCGGGKGYSLEVQNLSAKVFDSVQVFVDTEPGEGPTASHGTTLRPGQSMARLEVGELFTMGREQLPAMAVFYAADTVVRSNGPHNSMIQYKHYKITIDSSLRVNWGESEY